MTRLKRALAAIALLLLVAEAANLAFLSYVRATITTTASSTTALGNGATQAFTFTFVGGQASYIQVTYTDASGNSTVLPSSQYTLSLNAALPGAVWGIGGTVTYPTIASGQPPIATGTTLTIARTVPLIQSVSSNNGQLFPKAVEQGMDLLDMQIQQVSALFGRAIVQPITDTCTLTAMPGQTQRANQVLGFDSTGCNPIAVSSAPAGIISSAMQPVVSAPSLTAGRTAFGLGSASVENIGSYGMQDDGSGNLRQSFLQTSDATNKTINGTFHNTQRICTGPITYSLARASAVWNGFSVKIYAVSGICTVSPNVNDNFQGMASGTSIAIPAGSACTLTTNGASSGLWQADCSNGQPSLSASSNGTALTITLNGTTIAFRDTTLANGGALWAIPAAGLSITVPSGASLGTSSSNVPFRVWIFAAYNSGAPVLGVATCSSSTGIYACTSWETVRKTAAAITAGSTSLGTLYTASGITNDSVRIIGYADYASGLGTAGTWASAPTSIQLCVGPFVCRRPGDVVQTVRTASGTVISGTTAIPHDNTTPQITEGDPWFSQAITPTATPNILVIESYAAAGNSTTNWGAMALFQDATANALATAPAQFGGTTGPVTMLIKYQAIANGVASTTFKIRGGGNAGTTYLNGDGNLAGQAYGGSIGSYLQIQEIMG